MPVCFKNAGAILLAFFFSFQLAYAQSTPSSNSPVPQPTGTPSTPLPQPTGTPSTPLPQPAGTPSTPAPQPAGARNTAKPLGNHPSPAPKPNTATSKVLPAIAGSKTGGKMDSVPSNTKKSDSTQPVSKASGPFVLVLDAGHGGRASGALGSVSAEKDITLAICMKLGALIKARNPDIKLIYTRTSDQFVGLQERANIANSNRANLFIAIHCNSVPRHRASPVGAETYVLGLADVSRNLDAAMRENSDIKQEDNYLQTYGGFDPNSPESYIIFSMKQSRNLRKSLILANQIQAELSKNGRIDRGVKQEPLLVLRNTTMPGVLVETGYISNEDEEDYLLSEEGQQTIVQSMYDAIIKYKSLIYK